MNKSDACLFKDACLIEASSKFIQEINRNIHIFAMYFSFSPRQLMIRQMNFLKHLRKFFSRQRVCRLIFVY